MLDRVASKGNRSNLISEAVLHYVKTQSAANVRALLQEGALANAKLSLEIAEEWFSVEQEAWAETGTRRTIHEVYRVAGKSTSRRSLRR